MNCEYVAPVALSMPAAFKYAYVPADSSEPMHDLSLAVPPTLEENIGCLTKALQDHFRRTAPVAGEAGKQAVMDSVLEQLQKNSPGAQAPDERMLGMLAESQTVDIVQLLPATAQTGYVGVSLYVDDKGIAKGSPMNARASALCTACGMPTEVRGDAFVARAWDDQDGFERMDLTVTDLSSDAPWVREAVKANASRADPSAAAAKLQAMNVQPPPPPAAPLGERLAAATAAKAEGNECFKRGDVDGAATKYAEAAAQLGASGGGGATGGSGTSAVEDMSDVSAAAALEVVCLVNLAMCRLKQGQPFEAIGACDRAIELDKDAGKAWYRRGQACMALSQFAAARRNLNRAATLLPASREVRDEYVKCQALLAEKRAGVALDGAAEMED